MPWSVSDSDSPPDRVTGAFRRSVPRPPAAYLVPTAGPVTAMVGFVLTRGAPRRGAENIPENLSR